MSRVNSLYECWKCGKSYSYFDHENCPNCGENWLDEPKDTREAEDCQCECVYGIDMAKPDSDQAIQTTFQDGKIIDVKII